MLVEDRLCDSIFGGTKVIPGQFGMLLHRRRRTSSSKNLKISSSHHLQQHSLSSSSINMASISNPNLSLSSTINLLSSHNNYYNHLIIIILGGVRRRVCRGHCNQWRRNSVASSCTRRPDSSRARQNRWLLTMRGLAKETSKYTL